MARFGKLVKLIAFKPFTTAINALEQQNAVSESQLTDDLKHFLTLNLPKVGRNLVPEHLLHTSTEEPILLLFVGWRHALALRHQWPFINIMNQ